MNWARVVGVLSVIARFLRPTICTSTESLAPKKSKRKPARKTTGVGR